MQTYANNTLLEATADELQAMREQSTAPPPLDDGTTDELPSAKAVSWVCMGHFSLYIYRIKHGILYIYSIIWLLFCWHFFMIHAWNGKWERSLSTNLAGADSWRWSTCTYPCANRSWLFCHCPSARHETLTSKAVGFVWTMTYDASHMIVALLRLTSSRWPHRRPSVRNWRRDRSSCDSIQVHPNTIYLLYITSTCR